MTFFKKLIVLLTWRTTQRKAIDRDVTSRKNWGDSWAKPKGASLKVTNNAFTLPSIQIIVTKKVTKNVGIIPKFVI